MAITRQQLLQIGFKPAKKQKGLGKRKYDTLIYKINDDDYFYLGYNDFRGKVDFKRLWKSILTEEEGRISYPVDSIGDLSYSKLLYYIDVAKSASELKNNLVKELEEGDKYADYNQADISGT